MSSIKNHHHFHTDHSTFIRN